MSIKLEKSFKDWITQNPSAVGLLLVCHSLGFILSPRA